MWKGCDTGSIINANTCKSSDREYQSAKPLSLNVGCARMHRDDCFGVLSHARSRRHLDVLKSVYIISIQRPDHLCV